MHCAGVAVKVPEGRFCRRQGIVFRKAGFLLQEGRLPKARRQAFWGTKPAFLNSLVFIRLQGCISLVWLLVYFLHNYAGFWILCMPPAGHPMGNWWFVFRRLHGLRVIL